MLNLEKNFNSVIGGREELDEYEKERELYL